MTSGDLKLLLERVQSWPEAAQEQLFSIANEIETEVLGGEYVATEDELRILDAAMASIDAGDVASEADVEAAFAKFRRT